ncbi:uncharacterized protein LOC110868756 [Helianthus annuus]|uniref:uncharacterized protein LOC110868756 n=1 Tax=Helianthus annuus TaxID=4232 RepID=UPI000B8F9640|nr:uncharacterized protein LOC110868756 [Helianthus annuus]XP_021973701.1 uncharacterized protein LOC110868756 [Helianthus annuus]
MNCFFVSFSDPIITFYSKQERDRSHSVANPSSMMALILCARSPLEPGPTTTLPDRKLLVFILDRLQKKDTHAVLSEPVNLTEPIHEKRIWTTRPGSFRAKKLPLKDVTIMQSSRRLKKKKIYQGILRANIKRQ